MDHNKAESKDKGDCELLDEKMRDLTSIIITKDYEDLERILLDIKKIDFSRLTMYDILAHQFMEKINFAYAHHKEYPEMIDLFQ